LKSKSIRLFVLFGVFTIICIIMVQLTWLITSMNSESRKFNHSVHVALFEVYKKLSGSKNIPVRNPIKQISDDFYVVDLNQNITADILEFYLINEFDKLSIHTDFEYGIYDCSTDRIVYGGYICSSKTNTGKVKEITFPKVVDFTYYFVVRFPKRNDFIVSSIRIWIFFAAVSVFVLIFFGYALYVILRQKRLSDLQKDFINNMTHEFKTPLSSIKIAADYLHAQENIYKDSRNKKYTEIILAQNEHLNRQVENVLQLAQSEKNSFRPNKTLINLTELIDKIVSVTQANLKDRAKICFINSGGNVNVKMDELHVTNVVNSLIDNAVKYCDKEPIVDVCLECDHKNAYLCIKDNGIGIDREDLNHVFDKFYRVPTGNVHNVKGFGLGLYYVKNICKSHGWKISISSIISKGTQVTIQIPLT
jgi:two-component system, OmpR family, phosphate regulon sensor histidine kinase PhoR